MNILKLSIVASLMGLSIYANATVSGSADLTITGSLNGSNQCNISIDGGAVLDAGANYIADLSSSGDLISEFKAFNMAVDCLFPTAIAIKYTTSLEADTSNKLAVYKTTANKTAAHLYANLGPNIPTAGGVDHAYAEVGDQDLSTISSSDTFTVSSAGTPISSVAGHSRSAYTVINSTNNPIAATAFVLPFSLGVWSGNKSSGWADEIAEGIFSLSATVTVELHTI